MAPPAMTPAHLDSVKLMEWMPPAPASPAPKMEVLLIPQQGTPMSEITVIGLDLPKHVFQVHGVDPDGRPVLRKRLRRGQQAGDWPRSRGST